MSSTIDTDAFSKTMRERGVNVEDKTLRVTNFHGSAQEEDFTEPANCDGLGRIRHFKRKTSDGWPQNSLPTDPAAKALNLDAASGINAQVFQNAVCNWRCWYCFVDFDLLSGSTDRSRLIGAEELVGLYLAEDDPPPMIDLSGGQPDLVPEWAPWMVEALRAQGLGDTVYLWSDDNLSNDYFWRYLSEGDRILLEDNPMYGKVCCFKGFDRHSFAFNTAAHEEEFERQFDLMSRLLTETSIDLYAYATFTSDEPSGLEERMVAFVDRMQAIDPNLPLRTVPLEVSVFSPVVSRMTDERRRALEIQSDAVTIWLRELESRFTAEERGRPISDVQLRSRA